MMGFKSLLVALESICEEAGEAIMAVYKRSQAGFNIQSKTDDSPVTEADFAANAIILRRLRELDPSIPIISEESPIPPLEARRHWPRFWLVDPLDGTKEFIARNGEFTVNIALIENTAPVLGCVYVPVSKCLYSGAAGVGAWKLDGGKREALQIKPLREAIANGDSLRVVGSPSYGVPDLPQALASQFTAIESRFFGSSLKFCMLAEGLADFYPRFAPTMEWDTAAAQAVLEAAGGLILNTALQPLRYSLTENLLNPSFFAVADKDFDWQVLTDMA